MLFSFGNQSNTRSRVAAIQAMATVSISGPLSLAANSLIPIGKPGGTILRRISSTRRTIEKYRV